MLDLPIDEPKHPHHRGPSANYHGPGLHSAAIPRERYRASPSASSTTSLATSGPSTSSPASPRSPRDPDGALRPNHRLAHRGRHRPDGRRHPPSFPRPPLRGPGPGPDRAPQPHQRPGPSCSSSTARSTVRRSSRGDRNLAPWRSPLDQQWVHRPPAPGSVLDPPRRRPAHGDEACAPQPTRAPTRTRWLLCRIDAPEPRSARRPGSLVPRRAHPRSTSPPEIRVLRKHRSRRFLDAALATDGDIAHLEVAPLRGRAAGTS